MTLDSITVDLWAARLPGPFRFAEHCWLVIHRDQHADRWEVWQDADFGGESWGHLHRNLMAPTAGIRNHRAYWLQQWSGEAARRLARRIEDAPQTYPWCQTYRYVPGPNSNTFVQWCLKDLHRLSWRSVGAGYARRHRRRERSIHRVRHRPFRPTQSCSAVDPPSGSAAPSFASTLNGYTLN